MSKTIEKYLMKIREATSRPGKYAYRGQKNARWPLHSAATRRLRKEHGEEILQSANFPNVYLNYHSKTLVEPARTRGFGIEDGRNISDLQILAKLQHFGAATGLLDFTWNLLVALWFSSQDQTCDGKLFIVKTDNTIDMALVPSDEEKQDVKTIFSHMDSSPRLLYWEPTLSGDAMSRILRQRSVFIIGRFLIPEDTEVIKEIEVAKKDKDLLLKDLERLDISELSLFQDIYGFSEANSAGSSLQQIHDLEMHDSKDYLVQGNQFYQWGDYLWAINAYSTCIELEPDVCETYFLRGNAKAASGDHREAIKDYSEAIDHKDRPFLNIDYQNTEFNPILFMVYYNRGNSKAALKDYEGALQDYNDVQSDQLGAQHSCVYFNRANTYVDLGKFEEAVEDYDKAIQFETRQDLFNKGNTLFNKGNALVVMKRFEDALQCYRESEEQGMGSNAFANRRSLKSIIDRIRGQRWESCCEVSGGILIVSIRIPDYLGATEKYDFAGRVGNIGNFGTSDLLAGEGFSGGQGFVIQVGG